MWANTAFDHDKAVNVLEREYLRGGAAAEVGMLLGAWFLWGIAATPLAWGLIYATGEAWFLLIVPAIEAIVFMSFCGDRAADARTTKDFIESQAGLGTYVSRAEYMGGHPRLPKGRFLFLTLSGHRSAPHLTLHITKSMRVSIPLLDLEAADEKRERADPDVSDYVLATLTERSSGLLRRDKLSLVVRFKDDAGRIQAVEFENFRYGNSEIRNWKNFLICARGEAELPEAPIAPWARLPMAPVPSEEENINDATRNTVEYATPGNAFVRR